MPHRQVQKRHPSLIFTRKMDKIKDLEKNKEDSQNAFTTTHTGLRVNDDQNSLKAVIGDQACRRLFPA